MGDVSRILAVGEIEEGRLTRSTLEVLGAGARLANEMSASLCLLLCGEDAAGAANEGIASGASTIYLAKDPAILSFGAPAVARTIVAACAVASPSLVLLGHTDLGIDTAPRVAARLGAGLAMDCLNVEFDAQSGRCLMTRPVFGGNAHAVIACAPGLLQMATIRPYTCQPAEGDDSRTGEIVELSVQLAPEDQRVKAVGRVKEEAQGIKLEDARIIVSGGHGLGNQENFKRIWELAEVLGAAVGASRPVTEEGWVPSTILVGQTGKIVNPDVYIAVGISGAMQHMAGCGGAKCIVAINKNQEASIFGAAHVGVVADCNQLLPEMIRQLKEAS